MARGLSVPARDRLLADRIVQALLPVVEERWAPQFAAVERCIEERRQAFDKRLGHRFGSLSRQIRGAVEQTIRPCLEEDSV